MSHENIEFPAIGLIVSGGHTSLYYMPDNGKYQLLGSTVDDAVGESFDKVASLLGLPYPGGPNIERAARAGDAEKAKFPLGMIKKKSYNFSYEGLKTAVLYHVKVHGKSKIDTDIISENEKKDIAAGFQQAALTVLANKSFKAAEEYGAKSILVGGGVARNNALRELFEKKSLKKRVKTYFPRPELCTDNAAMVAGLGYIKYMKDPANAGFDFDADPNIRSLK